MITKWIYTRYKLWPYLDQRSNTHSSKNMIYGPGGIIYETISPSFFFSEYEQSEIFMKNTSNRAHPVHKRGLTKYNILHRTFNLKFYDYKPQFYK